MRLLVVAENWLLVKFVCQKAKKYEMERKTNVGIKSESIPQRIDPT